MVLSTNVPKIAEEVSRMTCNITLQEAMQKVSQEQLRRVRSLTPWRLPDRRHRNIGTAA